ncbi:MAG: SpoIIE family protein phosphatase [Planctomycetes bacterium]|nr:SpoIIE family protein phosphatase [Planctomycetota bacterium]
MRLIVLLDGAMVADVMCGREAVYVGSREGCRVRLEDERIAEQQAVIFPEGRSEWAIEQLAAGNELQVNDNVISARCGLMSGDEIRVCNYVIRVFPDVEEPVTPQAHVATSVARLTRFAQAQLPPGTMIKKLGETISELQSTQRTRIGEISLRLAQCSTVEELMDTALQTLLETFVAHRVWMGVRRMNYGPMEYVEGRLLTGQPADLPEHGDNYKPRVLDRSQFLLVPRVAVEVPASVMVGPLYASETTFGMVFVDTGDSGRRFEPQDLDFFVLLVDLLAIQLDAIIKRIAKTRAETIAGEVSVAHEIQARITPRKLPQWEQLQLGAFREPGRERTGDVYDVARLQSNLAGLMVAHTPATGPMPSMLMAQAQAIFRSAAMHQDGPQVFMRTLNWLLYDGQRDHAQNCFMGYVDPKTGQMRYSLAGHTGAYIIGARGDERSLAPKEDTPSLGLVKNAAYPVLPEQLEPGETVVLFTPGVTTAKNGQNETFGEERFVNILCDGFGQLASAMLKEMFVDLRNFTEGGSQPDDITVLLAHRL